MRGDELTGIERELVLQYLMLENVTLTLVPKDSDSLSFSVGPDETSVVGDGIIILRNPRRPLMSMMGKFFRIHFYFNKLGLYFDAVMRPSSAGPAFVIPPSIMKKKDAPVVEPEGLSVTIYAGAIPEKSLPPGHDGGILCRGEEDFPLFVRAPYKDVADRYLSLRTTGVRESIEGRACPPRVIYIDSERILLGSRKSDMPLSLGGECSARLRFPISGPIKERIVRIGCVVDEMYENFDRDRLCACLRISSIREEDARFLYDRTAAAGD